MLYTVLTNKQARRFLLLKQGLTGDYKFSGEQGICGYIKQAGCIQFDPIDVCGKNAELVLQSRINGFSKDMLYKLLYHDRKLIDYFDKNMSIFGIEDWKYFSRLRTAYGEYGRSKDQVNSIADKIKSVIKEKGFISSKDIDFEEQVDWAWNPTRLSRAALETLYFRGDLILHHKKGTIKYYALADEYISADILSFEDPNSTREEHLKWWILRRIGAVGLMWNKPSDAWLGIDGLKSSDRNTAFPGLLEEEKIIEVYIENISDPFYCLSSDGPLIEKVLDNNCFTERTEFIAPLDNLMWDRKLIRRIFDFDYKWEIYTPSEDRKYGYYVLPVLSGDSFIGRIEAVKDKKLKNLFVKNLWFEKGISRQDAVEKDIYDCIKRFARFNECENTKIECNIRPE